MRRINERMEYVRVDSLIITNEHLNQENVRRLTDELRSDQEIQHHSGFIRVREIDSKLYVNDGNHFVSACKILGIPTVLAYIYELNDE